MMQRNGSIDLLKVLCVLLVILYHVLGQGGVLLAITEPRHFSLAWLLRTLASCAVNCFAMISGFLMINKTFRYRKLISLYLTVLFYSVAISGIAMAVPGLRGKVTADIWLASCLPLTNNTYWFFTAYFGMCLFIPFVNRGDKRMLGMFVGIGFLCFSVLSTFVTDQDPFALRGGYSALWLILMYAIGALWRKVEIYPKTKSYVGALVALVSLLIAWGVTVYAKDNYIFAGKRFAWNFLTAYQAPTIVAEAFGLLVMFSAFHIRNGRLQKMAAVLANTSFAVYIIQCHPLVYNVLLKERFVSACGKPSWLFTVVAATFSIWLLCTLVELARQQAVRLLHLDHVLRWMYRQIDRVSEKCSAANHSQNLSQ